MSKRESLMQLRERVANRKSYDKICPTCGEPFTTPYNHKEECSDYCRDTKSGNLKPDDGIAGDVMKGIMDFDKLCENNRNVKIEMIGEIL